MATTSVKSIFDIATKQVENFIPKLKDLLNIDIKDSNFDPKNIIKDKEIWINPNVFPKANNPKAINFPWKQADPNLIPDQQVVLAAQNGEFEDGPGMQTARQLAENPYDVFKKFEQLGFTAEEAREAINAKNAFAMKNMSDEEFDKFINDPTFAEAYPAAAEFIKSDEYQALCNSNPPKSMDDRKNAILTQMNNDVEMHSNVYTAIKKYIGKDSVRSTLYGYEFSNNGSEFKPTRTNIPEFAVGKSDGSTINFNDKNVIQNAYQAMLTAARKGASLDDNSWFASIQNASDTISKTVMPRGTEFDNLTKSAPASSLTLNL